MSGNGALEDAVRIERVEAREDRREELRSLPERLHGRWSAFRFELREELRNLRALCPLVRSEEAADRCPLRQIARPQADRAGEPRLERKGRVCVQRRHARGGDVPARDGRRPATKDLDGRDGVRGRDLLHDLDPFDAAVPLDLTLIGVERDPVEEADPRAPGRARRGAPAGRRRPARRAAVEAHA